MLGCGLVAWSRWPAESTLAVVELAAWDQLVRPDARHSVKGKYGKRRLPRALSRGLGSPFWLLVSLLGAHRPPLLGERSRSRTRRHEHLVRLRNRGTAPVPTSRAVRRRNRSEIEESQLRCHQLG
jgi:hypothetical protein